MTYWQFVHLLKGNDERLIEEDRKYFFNYYYYYYFYYHFLIILYLFIKLIIYISIYKICSFT